MPVSTPQKLDIPAAWKGSEFDFRRDALRELADEDIKEIDAGLERFEKSGGKDFLDINPNTFPLPRIGRMMATLKYDLRYGSGVVLLRGLPRQRYNDDQISQIYFALGTFLGIAVPQSHKGELLGSVIDVSDADPGVRGYQAGGRQSFHTDGTACDIVALMCLRAAKSGGESRLVSAVAVHNAMIDRNPRLAQVFYDGFVYRKMDNDAAQAGVDPLSPKPVQVFAQENGEFFCNLNGGDIRRAIEKGDVKLTDIQIEAYDEFQKLANSDEFYLDMKIGEGDIQFVNNRSLLHGRLGYEDFDEVARRRYMLRLWLEVLDWPRRPQDQIVIDFDVARRWLKNRSPSMELPTQFVAAKQKDIAKRQEEGAATTRLKPYENISMRQFVSSAAPR